MITSRQLTRGTGCCYLALSSVTRDKIIELVAACNLCYVRFDGPDNSEVDIIQFVDPDKFDDPDPAYEALCRFFNPDPSLVQE